MHIITIISFSGSLTPIFDFYRSSNAEIFSITLKKIIFKAQSKDVKA